MSSKDGKPFARLTGVNRARVMQVMEIVSLAGNGDKVSPSREVTEYYDLEGKLLARRDTWKQGDLEVGEWFEKSLKETPNE